MHVKYQVMLRRGRENRKESCRGIDKDEEPETAQNPDPHVVDNLPLSLHQSLDLQFSVVLRAG